MTATGALGAAFALAAPLSASATTVPTSYASGQFLSGTIAGTNLAKLAALEAAIASNDGSQGTQTTSDPLGVSLLNSELINEPSGIQLNLGKIIDLGAVNQYAQAQNNGDSMGASGAVNNNGGVGVGATGGAADGNATVDLDSLLGSKYASVLSDLNLQAQAVSAQANGDLTSASGKYTLAGLKLNLQSPAIADLTSKVTESLGPIDAQLAALDGPNGKLAGAVNQITTGINPILNIAGADATVKASVNVDLAAALAPLLTGTYGNDGVSFNLQTGEVSVDLATLLGGQLNNEPVGTEVLTPKVVDSILNKITDTVNDLVSQILAKVKDVLNNAAVDVTAALNTTTPQASVTTQTCVAPTASQLLTDLGKLVNGLLCTPTTKLLPALDTSLNVHVDGTVAQLVNGTAPAATAKLTLLGVPVTVDLDNLTKAIGLQLSDNLLNSSAGENGLASNLNTNLVDPAVNGLFGSNSSVDNVLTHVLSITLNDQSTTTGTDGKTFTETALKVTALPDGTNSLATVNLANATVGPNADTVVTTPPGGGTPTGPGSGSNPTGPGSGSNPTGPGSGTTPAGSDGSLAFTGVGIAGLVAAILALLAAGAYLVREGYRRNGRRQIP